MSRPKIYVNICQMATVFMQEEKTIFYTNTSLRLTLKIQCSCNIYAKIYIN